MGQLVDGVWKTDWYAPDKQGAFRRPAAQFRSWVGKDGFDLEPGRYHLYAAFACPWAHRTIITRSLRELKDAIGITFVDTKMSDDGWSFGGQTGELDPLFDAKFLRDIYLRANAKYTGRVSVPVLWDKKKNTIVNNESREVMRMFNTVFDGLAKNPTLAPAHLHDEIDRNLDAIYEPYNNGVYRAGFATTQAAHEAACRDVFATLDRYDEVLGRQRYLCGNVLTEADVAMFTTSLRFDLVYYSHFKCNVRRLQDYPNVWGFVRDIYQMPAVKRTCHLDDIKVHYYFSQSSVNPHRIVPLGPSIDYDAAHDRAERFG